MQKKLQMPQIGYSIPIAYKFKKWIGLRFKNVIVTSLPVIEDTPILSIYA